MGILIKSLRLPYEGKVLTLTPFSSKEASTEVEDSVLTHPEVLLPYSSLPSSKKLSQKQQGWWEMSKGQ